MNDPTWTQAHPAEAAGPPQTETVDHTHTVAVINTTPQLHVLPACLQLLDDMEKLMVVEL